MIRSMTGFGRARGSLGPDTSAELAVRSVNHRFLDLTVKVRETEASLEPVLRRVFTRQISRGKDAPRTSLARRNASRSMRSICACRAR